MKPTKAELLAAADKLVLDIIAPNLKILFCGINPGLYSAATGHHFARPGNRFWPALFAGGLTPRLLHASEDQCLLDFGYGITNVVKRASARADELTRDEFITGGQQLEQTVLRYHPKWLAILGIGAYEHAFGIKHATVGPQPRTIGSTHIWLLPNPSGLNAHYTVARLGEVLAELKRASDQ